MAELTQPTAPDMGTQGTAVPDMGTDEAQQGTQAQAQTVTVETLQAEIARLGKALKDAHKDSERNKRRKDELEAEEQKRQQESMSETDKLKVQRDEFQKAVEKAQADNERFKTELASQVLKNAVISKAAEMGFANPADAFALADLTSIENDNGKYKGIDEALAVLKGRLPMRVVGPQRPAPPPQLGAMNPPDADTPQESDEQRRARLMGTRSNFFDARAAVLKGGGVMMSPQNPKQQPVQQ